MNIESIAEYIRNGLQGEDDGKNFEEIEASRQERLGKMASAEVFPPDQSYNATHVVPSAEGIRATFPGQGTEEGDRLVYEGAKAALQALDRQKK